jgi:Tol biopolymer transport system component
MGTGCQTRPSEDDALPNEPIALLHWEGKGARVRGEAFGSASELPPDPMDPADPEGAEENSIRVHLDAQSSLRLAAKLGKHAGHLVLFWPETGEIERIEAAPANARPLAWSPDHQRLLFVSAHRDGRRQLYEYNLNREDLTVLTVGPDEHTRADYDARGQLVIQKTESVAGGRPRQTAHLATSTGRLERQVAEGVRGGTLRILPAGDGIVYEQVKSRPRSDGPTVFESFIAFHGVRTGSQEEILARGREPDITPDGAWIVFASPTSAGYRLRRMRPDGTSRVPMGGLNPGGGDERMPSVSPDGDYVAFIEDKGSSRRLAVRRFDGKRGRVVLASGWSEFPVW